MENVSIQERNSKITGYATTIVFHALILLLLWTIVWGQPDPPLDSGGSGFTIALGLEDAGGASMVPVDDPTLQEPTPPTPDPEITEQPVVTEEEGEENTVIDPPKVEPKKTEPKKPIEKPIIKPIAKPVEQPRKADEKSLFKKRTTTRADESGFGEGDAPGNQGSADGDPNGAPDGNGYGNGGNGSGNGTGNGIGDGSKDGVGTYDLKGRTLSRRPVIEDNTKETGKVVVSIVVDRSGRVTKAMPNQKGTTTLNPALLEKAKQAALDTRFSPNPSAPEEQFGTMTIVFKFKP